MAHVAKIVYRRALENFLRSDEAERCVVDLQIADARGKAQVPVCAGSQIVSLVVGGDLLDVHRRWKFVERKVVRVDNADAIPQ